MIVALPLIVYPMMSLFDSLPTELEDAVHGRRTDACCRHRRFPIVVIALFTQKYVVSGLTPGATTG